MTLPPKPPTHFRLQLLAVLLTVLCIVIYDFLPPRSIEFAPAPRFERVLMSDGDIGGNSTVRWVNASKDHLLCSLAEGYQYPYCGVHFAFDPYTHTGLDLSPYTHLNLQVQYQGKANLLRVYVRNQERDAPSADTSRAKYISVNLKTRELSGPQSIRISEFIVAEWWKELFQIPRHLAQPQFDNIVSLGIEVFAPTPMGEHQLAIEQFEFVGPLVPRYAWYFSILGFWVTASFIYIVVRLIKLYRHNEIFAHVVSDLSKTNQELANQKEHYRALSSNDALTGIKNRHGIHLGYEAIKDTLGTHTKISLILIDIDHFKRINDRRGHQMGDEILSQFSDLLRRNTRENDIVGRWGGEEFIVVCSHTNLNQAELLSEKVRTVVSNSAFGDHKPIMITISCGVTEITTGESFDEALARADKCLYAAKHAGRNCTVAKLASEC